MSSAVCSRPRIARVASFRSSAQGAEVAGRVEAPRADGAPRFLLQDAAVDLEVPIDLQGLPLGIVVGAREADPRGCGRRGGLHRLHEPAPRAHLDELADARGTFGQQAESRAQWSSAQGSGQRVRLARTV